MKTLGDLLTNSNLDMEFSVYNGNWQETNPLWKTRLSGKEEIPPEILNRLIKNITYDTKNNELVIEVGEIQKARQGASNAKYYSCPMCTRMIPAETRRLDICRNCISGSKFEKRVVSKIAM